MTDARDIYRQSFDGGRWKQIEVHPSSEVGRALAALPVWTVYVDVHDSRYRYKRERGR